MEAASAVWAGTRGWRTGPESSLMPVFVGNRGVFAECVVRGSYDSYLKRATRQQVYARHAPLASKLICH